MISHTRLSHVAQYDWLDGRFRNVDWLLHERFWWRV